MKKLTLLHKIVIAIILGLALGSLLPVSLIRVFVTFNALFSSFLGFCIPLVILGLIAPSIADTGSKGKFLLLVTVALAYISTITVGLSTYALGSSIFPNFISFAPQMVESLDAEHGMLSGYFTLKITPPFDVMTALLLSFVLGLGMTSGKLKSMHSFFLDFRTVVEKLITSVIIPVLPFYIFGIFLNMKQSGAAFQIITVFGKLIIFIFILHISVLLILYIIAGIVAKRNPLKMLATMMPAYFTALGTSSSAATIPVTVTQAKKNGISEDIADFAIPLFATIHMPGSMLKIVSTSLAICIMLGIDHSFAIYAGFVAMLSILMVAAPGVPGGAIMVSVAVLQTRLGFDASASGLMIALYVAIDSFGTACNVTGDGALAVIVEKISKIKLKKSIA